jgi:hypothetical protein
LVSHRWGWNAVAQKKQGQMTVREAGQKGGQKVRNLIEEGKRAMEHATRKEGRK